MISEGEAKRLDGWIQDAIAAGATLLCGGKREGAMLEATLLEEVPKDQDVCTQEAFGPVAVLSKFSDFDDALQEVNDSAFGLQAGIFTRDLVQDAESLGRIGSRWRGDRRCALLASRQHALRRSQGQRAGPRRYSIRHGRHDRNSKPSDTYTSAARVEWTAEEEITTLGVV